MERVKIVRRAFAERTAKLRHRGRVHWEMFLMDWDSTLYYVDALPNQVVLAYKRVDTRLGLRFGESEEISLVGQNLLTPRHSEFGDDTPQHTKAQRSVFGKAVWRF